MRSPIRLQDGDRNMARPHAVLRDRADKEPHHAAFVVRRHRYQRRVQLVSLDADGVAYAVAVAAGARHDGHMVQALRVCGPDSRGTAGGSQPAASAPHTQAASGAPLPAQLQAQSAP